MTKRLFVAMIGCAFTLAAVPAEARTYDHDGVHESRPAKARTRSRGGASASRACLKPSARALLDRIEAQFGPVRVVSTCRPGARIAGTGKISKHATGEAIDFYAPAGRKAEVVRWLIANHNSGGVMTYARMGHIHVDIGYRFVSLGSGGGRATRVASRSSASRVASRSQARTERMQASREMPADAVLRLAQKD
ncbi:MAG TPA: D-Ala-D-Ala carboxypeptidase family metallohydrolase [Hyphomicrobiaceae bacterium]|nr:D-Ala-D-Ala carboxypeptidase family metallohydrolase [Hyphomicrobiaceae bacterium]